MRKIILTLILLFPFLVSASRMDQEIEILPNGDLKIRESIAIDGSYNGFRLTLGYKYYGEEQIYGADTLEVIKVCESNKENPLEDIGECFKKVSYAEKGDSLKYTHEIDEVDTFMLYNPSSRKKAFYIEYILKNVIVGHNDINELRLNLLDSSFNESLDSINIKVKLPQEANDLRAWAHGPLWGNIKIDDNKEYVTFTIDEYGAYTAVDIRITFDKNLVTTSKQTNVDKLSSVIDEETILADIANKEREEAKKQKEEQLKIISKKSKEAFFLSSTWLVGLAIMFIQFYKKHDKEYESNFTNQYYRDFPSNHSPEIIEYLMKKRISTTSLSASLLNIIYKGGFIVKKKEVEKGLIKKKIVNDYELTLNDENLKEPLTENEIRLRSWLLSSFSLDNSFFLSDLKNTDSSYKEANEFVSEFETWKRHVVVEAEKELFYEQKSTKKLLLVLFGCIPFIIIPKYVDYSILVLLLAPISVAFIIYILTAKKRTKNGNELFLKWNGLKNFIKDFGSFSDRELPEIKLWEKYLVYAHIFGLADELRKQMEIKMPDLDDNLNGMSSYDYMVLNNELSKSVTNSVNSAITNATSKIAESTSSSGSGSGGGFSSGGGFGGGGGSGGGRF